MQITTDVSSNTQAAASVTRRDFLRAIGHASACRVRALVAGFTSITGSDLDLWFHRCFFGGGQRFAGAG